MDAAFEIAIAAQYRNRHKIVFLDGKRRSIRVVTLLPMQVVQPYHEMNFSLSRY